MASKSVPKPQTANSEGHAEMALSTVTNIRGIASRDTGAVLRELLELWERGELRGLVFGYKNGPNRHEVGCTGDYRRDLNQVLVAAGRMAHCANQMIDQSDVGAAKASI